MTQRPIKFRVWDTVSKVMVTEEDASNLVVSMHNQEVYFVERTRGQEANFMYRPSLAVQQFTGLKDKNGKEIYEGDVLSWRDYPVPEDPTLGLQEERGQVAYGTSGFYVERGDIDELVDEEVDGIISKEVIGNVWENPELLKQ